MIGSTNGDYFWTCARGEFKYYIFPIDIIHKSARPQIMTRITSKSRLGRQVASSLSPRSALLGHRLGRAVIPWNFMKKPSRRDHPSESSHRSPRDCRQNGGSEGRWEFTASGSLFALGSTDAVRRAAYRTAAGEMRFLPL